MDVEFKADSAASYLKMGTAETISTLEFYYNLVGLNLDHDINTK